MHNTGLHHLSKRKRIHLKKEKYPHPNKWIRLFDILIYVVAIFGPLITLPQVLKIWQDYDASGVSLFSWVGYTCAASLWLVYGVMHKEKPIIFANMVGIVMNLSVVSGVWIYG